MSTADASAGEDRLGEAIHVDADGTTRPEGISESEHAAIIGAVNALLTDRAKPPESLPRQRSRRSGIGMVLLTNLLILLVLAGGGYAYITFVPRSAPDVNLFSGQVATSEGAILAEVREQTEQRLSERETEIARIERELNALRSTRADADPSDDASQRERELVAELENLNATASERLNALESNQDQLSFLTTQLTAVYERIGRSIRAQDYERARTLVDDAGALIAAPGIQNEPMLREAARPITAANEVLARVLPLAAEDSSRLAVLAEQVEEIDLIVAQADARAAAGELENAESLYRSALRVFSGTERAATRLLEFQEERFDAQLAEQETAAQRRMAQLNAQLRESRSTVSSLETQVASLTEERTRLAAERSRLADERSRLAADVERLQADVARAEAAADRARARSTELGSAITELEAQIAEREQRIATLEAERQRAATQAAREIAELRATVASMEAASRETAAALTRAAGDVAEEFALADDAYDGPAVIDLLSTRVLLRAVVDSPSVREQYPQLYEDMETYFTALSRSRMDEGRTTAYTRASEAVEALAAGMGIDLETDTPPDAASGYLDRVVALVRGAIGSVAGE